MSKRLPKLTEARYRDILCRAFKTEEAKERQRQKEFDAFLAQMSAPGDPPTREEGAHE
jgi:hypothetical protein